MVIMAPVDRNPRIGPRRLSSASRRTRSRRDGADALRSENGARIREARANVLGRERRVVLDDLCLRPTLGEQVDDELYGQTRALHDRLAGQNRRVDHDPFLPLRHARSIRENAAGVGRTPRSPHAPIACSSHNLQYVDTARPRVSSRNDSVFARSAIAVITGSVTSSPMHSINTPAITATIAH